MGSKFFGLVLLIFAVTACSGATEAEIEPIDTSAMTTPATFSGNQLARLGFINTGIVVDAKTTFQSLVRPGLTAVQVPGDLRFTFSDGPWQPDTRPGDRIGFAAKIDFRWYHIEVQLRDAAGEHLQRDAGGSYPLNFEYEGNDVIQVRNQGADAFQVVLSANSSLDSDPRTAFAWPTEQGAWHRVAVDAKGHIWVESRPQAGLGGVIAHSTGETIGVGPLERFGQAYRGSQYTNQGAGFITVCGVSDKNKGHCYLHSKGPLTVTLPSLMDGLLTCRLDSDPEHHGRFLIVSLETPNWTLDLLGVLGVEAGVCPGLTAVLPGGFPIPVRGLALRARDAAGNLTDLVVTLDGRLFVSDAGTSLTCPPCLYDRSGGRSIIY